MRHTTLGKFGACHLCVAPVTAFAMVNAFQRYVNTFGRDDNDIQNFIDCGLLIIDDLGTEPAIKNITQEHIYNIINERLLYARPFIITTNLSPAALADRYDQRLASRILSKDASTVISFSGSDLRIKSPAPNPSNPRKNPQNKKS